jgi:integrase
VRGHIRPRGKGTWSLAVYRGRDPETGKIRLWNATVKGTKKEAEAELARMIRSVETGTHLDPNRLTVTEFVEHWLRAKEATLKQRTHAGYADVFRLHVTPVVGSVRLTKLKPLHL